MCLSAPELCYPGKTLSRTNSKKPVQFANLGEFGEFSLFFPGQKSSVFRQTPLSREPACESAFLLFFLVWPKPA